MKTYWLILILQCIIHLSYSQTSYELYQCINPNKVVEKLYKTYSSESVTFSYSSTVNPSKISLITQKLTDNSWKVQFPGSADIYVLTEYYAQESCHITCKNPDGTIQKFEGNCPVNYTERIYHNAKNLHEKLYVINGCFADCSIAEIYYSSSTNKKLIQAQNIQYEYFAKKCTFTLHSSSQQYKLSYLVTPSELEIIKPDGKKEVYIMENNDD